MKILAVDTSGQVATVAIIEDRRILGEYFLNHKKTHSQKLMPLILSLINELELKIGDIDVFAASVGPGSFTGIRIGVTTIKSLAYTLNRPVVAVNTLDALAYNVFTMQNLICPIMDARNNQVFTALYKNSKSNFARLTEYLGVDIKELVDLIEKKNTDVIFVGDGIDIHKEYLKKVLGEKCDFMSWQFMLQRASSVALLAFDRISSEGFDKCEEILPFYLRKSQAEREYERIQAEKRNDSV